MCPYKANQRPVSGIVSEHDNPVFVTAYSKDNSVVLQQADLAQISLRLVRRVPCCRRAERVSVEVAEAKGERIAVRGAEALSDGEAVAVQTGT